MGKRGNPNFTKKSIHDGAPDLEQIPDHTRVSLHRTDGLAARAIARRIDGYRNAISGLGTGRDRSVYTSFRADVVNFDLAMELARGDDIAIRACEWLPKAAKRKGYDIVVQGDDGGKDLGEEVRGNHDMHGSDDYLLTAGVYERIYGGAAVLLGANDGSDDLTKPLDEERVSELNFLTVLEARELMPLYGYADPRQPKYGQPEIYQLVSRSVLPSHSGKYAAVTMQIHESRLLVFPGLRVSRYQIASQQGGWGDSILTRMWRVLRAFNEVYGHVEHLMGEFAQAVYKLKGLYDSMSGDNDGKLMQRLQAMDQGRSTIRALVLDAEDDFERKTTSLAGVPDVMREFSVRLAAAADTTVTRLFGTSPAGLNATGESDIAHDDDRVMAYQHDKLRPHLRRLVQILMRIETNGKPLPEQWDVKFRPLRQPTEKDIATAHFTQAQADVAYVNAGVVAAEEIALSRFGGAEFSYDTHVDFNAREQQEQIASPPVSPAELAVVRPGNQPSKDYTPPPEQGTAVAHTTVAPPGKAAAPDPNTPPVPVVQPED